MSSFDQAITDVSGSVKSFFTNTFVSVCITGPQLDPAQIQKSPVMLVSTHRSHIDYFLIGYNFFKMGFRNLRFAAGDNLTNLPYLGSRFKSWGAFPVERDVGFERNYVRNLCKSVVRMMDEKQAIIVFPEGGRSYSGAMLELKNGILGAAVLSQARVPDGDVYLLPIAISYECPPDLPYFGMLLSGKHLRKRNNSFLKRLMGNIYYFGADLMAYALVLSAKWTKRKYGTVYIDYQEPVSIRKISDIESNRIAKARDEFSSHRVSMQRVSEVMHEKLLNLYRILPVHVMASILDGKDAVSTARASEAVPALLEELRRKSRNIKQIDSADPLQVVRLGTQQLLRLKAVRVRGDVVTVRNKNIIDYFIASVKSMR